MTQTTGLSNILSCNRLSRINGFSLYITKQIIGHIQACFCIFRTDILTQIQVIYDCEAFLEKNRDTLSSNLDECLKNSESDFICKMFYAEMSQRGSMLTK